MKQAIIAIIIIIAFLVAGNALFADLAPEQSNNIQPVPVAIPVSTEIPDDAAVATFAGGCFWCTEAVFQELDGVYEVISGYAGGTQLNPTYEDVFTQNTDHREAVQIYYDDEVVSYEELLEHLWPTIDPTDDGGQFVDRGFSYTTAIFFHDDEQQAAAELSKDALADSGRFGDFELVTPILPYTTFWEAEDYHQDFYLNSAERYKGYADYSGRDEYKAAIWAEIEASQ